MLSTHLSERGQLKENRVARVNWRHRRKCVTEITSKSFDGFNWFTFIEHWTFLLELDGFDCGYLLHVNEINWVFTIEISFWRTFELSLDKKNFNAEILCEIWYNFFFNYWAQFCNQFHWFPSYISSTNNDIIYKPTNTMSFVCNQCSKKRKPRL